MVQQQQHCACKLWKIFHFLRCAALQRTLCVWGLKNAARADLEYLVAAAQPLLSARQAVRLDGVHEDADGVAALEHDAQVLVRSRLLEEDEARLARHVRVLVLLRARFRAANRQKPSYVGERGKNVQCSSHCHLVFAGSSVHRACVGSFSHTPVMYTF